MSREIKFRAWDNRNNKWIYGPSDDVISPSWVLTMCSANNEEPYQYTGLTDKNGVEIYEGDICSVYEVMDYGRGLEDKSYITDIKYDEAAFLVRSGTEDYDTFLSGWFPGGGTRYPQIEFVVIGNIYENPNLLEGESK